MEKSHNGFEEDKQRFRFQVTLAIVILIGLAAVGWRGRSAYRHYKERHSLAQAQAFLASGDYRNALLSARQTLLLNPTNVPVCRVMVALAELSHSPAVLDWQRRIVQTEPTVENKLLLASSGLRYQSPPFPLTAQIMDELAATATNRANYQVVAASLALGTRRLAEAEAHFEIAVQLEPTNRLHELQLAILRLGATNETKVAAARAVLETLRTENGTTILLVEQNAKAALKLADRGYVLETGKVILEGPADELMENAEVKRAYLGKDKKEIWER